MSLGLLVLFQVLWASTYSVMKLSLAAMPLAWVLLFRYGISVAAFALLGKFNQPAQFSKKEWGLVVLAGLLTFAASPFFQLQSLRLTDASDIAVLIAFEPLVLACLGALLLKEKLSHSTRLAFLLATIGVLVMNGLPTAANPFGWQRLLGDLVFMLAIFSEGFTGIIAKGLTQKHSPLQLTAWMVLSGFIGNLVGSTPHLLAHGLPQISWDGVLMMLHLSLLCTVFSYVGWFTILSRIPLNQIALSLFLQPFFGVVLAVWILGETMTFHKLLGSGIVLTSLFVWLWKRVQNRMVVVSDN